MKLAAIKPNELAIVKNETLIPIGEPLLRQGIDDDRSHHRL